MIQRGSRERLGFKTANRVWIGAVVGDDFDGDRHD